MKNITFIVLLALAVFIAACGGNQDSVSASTVTEDQAIVAATDTAAKVKIIQERLLEDRIKDWKSGLERLNAPAAPPSLEEQIRGVDPLLTAACIAEGKQQAANILQAVLWLESEEEKAQALEALGVTADQITAYKRTANIELAKVLLELAKTGKQPCVEFTRRYSEGGPDMLKIRLIEEAVHRLTEVKADPKEIGATTLEIRELHKQSFKKAAAVFAEQIADAEDEDKRRAIADVAHTLTETMDWYNYTAEDLGIAEDVVVRAREIAKEYGEEG